MLYHMHELQHMVLSPYRAWLKASRTAMKPFQHAAYARPVAAGLEVAERLTRRYDKPTFDFKTIKLPAVNGAKAVSVHVREVVADETPFCNLVHFKKEGVSGQPKVLIVAPLSGHYATLLRGTVEAMLPEHDVYISDWTDGRDVPVRDGTFHLDDYIELMIRYLELLGQGCHVLAVCQPSVPVLAAVAVQSARIAKGETAALPSTMTLMGGPVDTRACPTAVNDFAKEHDINWFKSHSIHRVPLVYPGSGRQVYPGFLQLQSFLGMNIDRHMNAHVDHFWHLCKGDGDGAGQHRKFYDEYMSVMDLPAEYFLDTITAVFHDHALPKGELMFRGEKINPGEICDVALMTVEGELDDISGVGQTAAAHTICPDIPDAKRKRIVQKDVGHYVYSTDANGVVSSSRNWRNLSKLMVR